LEASGNATPELLAEIDKIIAGMNESLHISIEEDFRPYLRFMLTGNLGFSLDPAAATAFFRGIAAQYLRTNQIKKARVTLGTERLETFQRIVNVLVHIYEINVGFSLYADRERYNILLLKLKGQTK
jgi:hypothetical protein